MGVFKNVTLFGPYVAAMAEGCVYALCQLDSVLTLAVYGCSQSSVY